MRHKPFSPLRWTVPSVLAIACSSDCVYYPCPVPEAARITVTSSSSTSAIAGVTATVTGASSGSGPCQSGTSGAATCDVVGGPGDYQAQLSAPGFKTTTINFTVTGTLAGCNTCGQVDTRALSVVMQPTGPTS